MDGSHSESPDLETLEPIADGKDLPRPPHSRRPVWQRRLVVLLAVVLGALAGSVITLAVVDHSETNDALPSRSSVPTTSMMPVGHVVQRVGQWTRLGDWNVLVRDYHVVGKFNGERAAPGRKWLVTQLEVTNESQSDLYFPYDIEARYRPEGVGWGSVGAHLTFPDSKRVRSAETYRRAIAFSIPEGAQVYTVVLRQDLDWDNAVEIDLNFS